MIKRRTDHGGHSPRRHGAVLAAVTVISLLVGLPATAGPALAGSSSLPPVPAGLYVQSRCAALVLSNPVVDRAFRSSRVRRQLEHSRSLEAEVDELRRRLEAIERHLGLS